MAKKAIGCTSQPWRIVSEGATGLRRSRFLTTSGGRWSALPAPQSPERIQRSNDRLLLAKVRCWRALILLMFLLPHPPHAPP
eukprot:5346793-Pyramimonas_sp.AAC.1